MGVFSTNLSEISAGALISASHTSDLYNVLSGNIREDVVISGSLTVIGDLAGNLQGTAATASYVLNAVTASYVESASYALNSTSSSFASYVSGSEIYATSGSINYVNVLDIFITKGTVLMYTASLPEIDPEVNGQLWRNGSYLMISTGSGI